MQSRLLIDRDRLVELLRGRLGFAGVVVSDYFTVPTLLQYHHIARDEREAARLALMAGIDIELPAQHCYGAPLRQAVLDSYGRGAVGGSGADGAAGAAPDDVQAEGTSA